MEIEEIAGRVIGCSVHVQNELAWYYVTVWGTYPRFRKYCTVLATLSFFWGGGFLDKPSGNTIVHQQHS